LGTFKLDRNCRSLAPAKASPASSGNCLSAAPSVFSMGHLEHVFRLLGGLRRRELILSRSGGRSPKSMCNSGCAVAGSCRWSWACGHITSLCLHLHCAAAVLLIRTLVVGFSTHSDSGPPHLSPRHLQSPCCCTRSHSEVPGECGFWGTLPSPTVLSDWTAWVLVPDALAPWLTQFLPEVCPSLFCPAFIAKQHPGILEHAPSAGPPAVPIPVPMEFHRPSRELFSL
jgi:hypothetical protein